MVRPYATKERKRKRIEKIYDKDMKNLEEEDTMEAIEIQDKKRAEEATNDLPGIPSASLDQKNKTGVIFILEKASLEVAKVGKSYQILSSEDHTNFLRKNNKNLADYRPDIVHQALLAILDSPLNKAGRVKGVYVRTEKGVLFEVKPHVRIPRTYKRFSGIMLQLLQKLSITAVGTREKLFRVIKNPVTQYLPIGSRKLGFSYSSDKSVTMLDYLRTIEDDTNLVFVVGAMAHGKIDKDYTDDYISVSDYPLSAAWCIAKICEAVHTKWNIH